MSTIRGLAPALGALTLLAACAQYERARMEFDSVTGFDRVVDEPATFEFRKDMLRWPWLIRTFEGSSIDWFFAVVSGSRPSLQPVENPSGTVRDRATEMTGLAIGDFGRMADVSLRVLWIAERDDHPLDQIVAIQSMEAMLRELQVDPLNAPGTTRDLERIRRELDRLDALAPQRRGNRPLTALEHLAYLSALETVSARPSASPELDRRTIRTLRAAAIAEAAPQRLAATRRALVDTMAGSMSQATRVKLASPSPEVREATLLSLYRLSGPVSVPWALRVVSRRNVDGMGAYDPSPTVRRTMIRLCADLPRDYLLFASFERGPRPIEFLYDVATTDFDPSLRLLALDVAAQQIGQPMNADQAWFDAWWRDYSLNRGAETGR